jgi:hypothetical protein
MTKAVFKGNEAFEVLLKRTEGEIVLFYYCGSGIETEKIADREL